MDIQQPDFGRRLREVRRARGLSQRDVAVGVVNPSYISLLETGARVPTLDVVVHLAQALGVPLGDLVAGAADLPAQPLAEVSSTDQGSTVVQDLLARSSMSLGEFGAARTRFAQAYQHARDAGKVTVAVQYGFELAEVLRTLGDYQARHELLVDLNSVIDAAGLPPEVQVKARTDLASAARETGRLGEALELAENAVKRLAESELANTVEHVRALGVLIAIRGDSGELGELRATITQMLGIAESLDSPSILGRAHWVAFMGYGLLEDEQAAHQHVLRAHDMLATPTTSMQDWMRFCRAAGAALLRVGASAAEVDRYLGPARAYLELVDTPAERSNLTILEARYQLEFGEPAAALELVKKAIPDLQGADVASARMTAGRALVCLGRTGEAIDEMRTAASEYETLSAYRNAAAAWREIDELRSA